MNRLVLGCYSSPNAIRSNLRAEVTDIVTEARKRNSGVLVERVYHAPDVAACMMAEIFNGHYNTPSTLLRGVESFGLHYPGNDFRGDTIALAPRAASVLEDEIIRDVGSGSVFVFTSALVMQGMAEYLVGSADLRVLHSAAPSVQVFSPCS